MLSRSWLVSLQLVLWMLGTGAALGQSETPSLSEEAAELALDLYSEALAASERQDEQRVLQLWFLFFSLSSDAAKAPYLENWQSLIWGAVGHLDLCPESLPAERSGLWPLVIYNHMVRHQQVIAATDPEPADTLRSFREGLQARRVRYDQILSFEEIESLKSYRDHCAPWTSILKAKALLGEEIPPEDLNREARARILHRLLQKTKETIQLAAGEEWLQLRLFTFQLYLSGSSEAAIAASLPFVLSLMRGPDSQIQAFDAATRLYLVQTLDSSNLEVAAKQEIFLRWLDLAISFEDAKLIDSLIKRLDTLNPALRETIWSGTRGEQLLELGKRGIFSEAASVALHRGLAAAEVLDQLRYFSLAIRLAPLGRAEGVADQAFDWITFTLERYRFDKKLLSFLRSFLDPASLRRLINDLVWASVFVGEDSVIQNSELRELIGRRMREEAPRLELLARRKIEAFMRSYIADLQTRPRLVIQFTAEMLRQLEKQPFPVIHAHLQLVAKMHAALYQKLPRKQLERGQGQMLLEAFDRLLVHQKSESPELAARQLRSHELTTLGTLRVEPSRDVPWIFPQPAEVGFDVFQEIPYVLSRSAERSSRDGASLRELRWRLLSPAAR